MPTDPSLASDAPLNPQTSGHGLELSPEAWSQTILGPLMAASAIMSMNLHVEDGYGPIHLPRVTAAPITDDAWADEDVLIEEIDLATAGPTLLDRGVKSLKTIARISNATLRSSVDSPLDAAQTAIANELVKKLDPALINGSTAGGITGLIAQAGAVVNSTPDNEFDDMQDAFTEALDNYARPSVWLVNTRSLGGLYKLKDNDGRQLINPALAAPSSPGEQPSGRVVMGTLLGLPVLAVPSVPYGTAVLVEEDQVYLGRDLDFSVAILNELYAAWDQVGIRIISRWDIQVVNSFGVIVVNGLGGAPLPA